MKRWMGIITKDLASSGISWHLAKDSQDLIHAKPTPAIITIDIPIVLKDRGSRESDFVEGITNEG